MSKHSSHKGHPVIVDGVEFASISLVLARYGFKQNGQWRKTLESNGHTVEIPQCGGPEPSDDDGLHDNLRAEDIGEVQDLGRHECLIRDPCTHGLGSVA